MRISPSKQTELFDARTGHPATDALQYQIGVPATGGSSRPHDLSHRMANRPFRARFCVYASAALMRDHPWRAPVATYLVWAGGPANTSRHRMCEKPSHLGEENPGSARIDVVTECFCQSGWHHAGRARTTGFMAVARRHHRSRPQHPRAGADGRDAAGLELHLDPAGDGAAAAKARVALSHRGDRLAGIR